MSSTNTTGIAGETAPPIERSHSRLAQLYATRVQPRLPGTVSAGRQYPLILAMMFTGLVAIPGMYWDIGWHIDLGRDTALSPPHVVMIAGAFIVGMPAMLFWFVLVYLVVGLNGGRALMPVRYLRGVPYPPIVAVALLTIILPQIALGLDELWHRTYGLDVSLWSPTHLLALTTAPVAFLSIFAIIVAELNHTQPDRSQPRLRDWRTAGLPELFLVVGMALFASAMFIPWAEFDFAIPQWRLSFAPPVLAGLTALPTFMAIETIGRRWSATAVMGGFTLIRLLSVGFVMATGRTAPDIVLPIVAAFCVDLILIAGGGRLRGRALAAALVAFPIVVVATEAGRLLITGQDKWLSGIFPYAWAWAIVVGIASGYVGVRAGRLLRPVDVRATAARPTAGSDAGVSARGRRRRAAIAGAVLTLVVALLVAGPAAARVVVPATMEVTPAKPRPGEPIRVRVTGFERVLDVSPRLPFGESVKPTGQTAPFLLRERKPPRLQSFYGGKWIYTPLRRLPDGSFETTFRAPFSGRWMTTPTFYLGDLRWTDRQSIYVDDDFPPAVGQGSMRFPLELVDESAPARAPEWVKPFAYVLLAAVALFTLFIATTQMKIIRDAGIVEAA